MRRQSVGIKQVAERAGVSLGTVSNVLNRPELVAEATRRRVMDVIDETGFVRNSSASRLRSHDNTTVGLVVLDVGNPFFAEVARGVEEVAEASGYTVMFCNSDGSTDRETRHLRFLEEQRVAGLLVTPAGAATNATLERLRDRGVSVVLVDEPSREPDRCSVAVDDIQGGDLGGQHLLDLGRRRIVFVSGPPTVRQYADRLAGLERAVKRHPAGAETEISVVTIPSLNGRSGYGATTDILDLQPDAVFCANDMVALGVLRGLLEREVSVPGQIALIGYDDIEFAALAAIPLTSVRQPALQIGRSAAKLLVEECSDHDHAHQQVIFQPELVVRSSTSSDPGIGGQR